MAEREVLETTAAAAAVAEAREYQPMGPLTAEAHHPLEPGKIGDEVVPLETAAAAGGATAETGAAGEGGGAEAGAEAGTREEDKGDGVCLLVDATHTQKGAKQCTANPNPKETIHAGQAATADLLCARGGNQSGGGKGTEIRLLSGVICPSSSPPPPSAAAAGFAETQRPSFFND